MAARSDVVVTVKIGSAARDHTGDKRKRMEKLRTLTIASLLIVVGRMRPDCVIELE
jgi:hypothetical protein